MTFPVQHIFSPIPKSLDFPVVLYCLLPEPPQVMTAILTLAFEEEPQSYPRAIKDRTSENNVADQLLTSKYLQEHMMPMLIFPSALRGT